MYQSHKIMPVSEKVQETFEDIVQQVIRSKDGLRNIISVHENDEIKNAKATTGRRSETQKSPFENGRLYSYQVFPMLEPKIYFDIDEDELYQIENGLEPFGLDGLEKAVEQLIAFEHNVFFNGFSESEVLGLFSFLKNPVLTTNGSPESIVQTILKAAVILRDNYVQGPYKILMGKPFLAYTAQILGGKTLAGIIEDELEENIEVSDTLSGAVLMPKCHAELGINRSADVAVGWEGISEKSGRFFVSERFNLSLLNPSVAVRIEIAER